MNYLQLEPKLAHEILKDLTTGQLQQALETVTRRANIYLNNNNPSAARFYEEVVDFIENMIVERTLLQD